MGIEKLIAILFMPLSILFIITYILSIKIKQKYLIRFLLILSIVIYLLSTGIISSKFQSSIEKKYPYLKKEDIKCDIIVTLGGNANDRIYSTAKLWYWTKNKIILSGETDMKKMLIELQQFGIPKKDIILEDKSKSTYENAILTKKILIKNNLNKVCLITSAYHLPRAVMIFEHLGINVIPISAKNIFDDNKSELNISHFLPKVEYLYYSTRVIMEYLGMKFYKIKYNIKEKENERNNFSRR